MPPRIKKRILIPGRKNPRPRPPKPVPPKPPKVKAKPKYHAAGEWIEDLYFASGAEAERYRQLAALVESGAIDALKLQPRFNLMVNNVKIAEYRADFAYDVIDGRGMALRSVIEDVKGVVTPAFRIKHKLFNALFPQLELSIIEVGSQRQRKSLEPDGLGSSARWVREHWSGRIPDTRSMT